MKIYKRTQNGKEDTAYSCRFRTHTGRVAQVALFADKGASQAAANSIARLVDLRAAGREPGGELLNFIDHCGERLRAKLAELDVITPEQTAAVKPLSKLIGEWDATRRSRSPKAQAESAGRVQKICEGCRFRSLLEIDAGAVNRYLEGMGKSARTYNLYLTNLKTFLGWCVKTGLLAANPLRALDPKDTASDRRRERRALDEEEIARLLAATEAGKDHHGMTGHERMLVYWLATEAGPRLNEIYTLQRKSLHLDGERPYVTLEGTNTKNGKTESVAITPELAGALAAYVAATPALPTARLFQGMWHGRGSKMLREDLKAAGIAYRDEMGRVVDFHALRHTCGTRLLRNGVSLAVAQKQMRHSTPILTANTYGHIELIDKAAAVQSLPTLAPQATAEAVGGESLVPHLVPFSGQKVSNSVTNPNCSISPTINANNEKTRETQGFPGFKSGAGKETRTLGLQSHNLNAKTHNTLCNQRLAMTEESDSHLVSHLATLEAELERREAENAALRERLDNLTANLERLTVLFAQAQAQKSAISPTTALDAPETQENQKVVSDHSPAPDTAAGAEKTSQKIRGNAKKSAKGGRNDAPGTADWFTLAGNLIDATQITISV